MEFLQQSIIIFNLLTFLTLIAISCQILHHSYYISAGTLPTSKRKKNGYRAIFRHFLIFDLLETNIRQRGDVGGSAKKFGLRIKELERIYGIQNGSSSFQGNQHEVVTNNSEAPKHTQEQLATQMGISVDTLHNYKILADMIPELSDLVDTGIVTKTTESEFSMILFLDIFQFLHIGIKLIDTFLSCCLIVAPFFTSI